jgi:hypothetical protein
MEIEMNHLKTLSGAALVTLLLVPGPSFALSRTIQNVDPVGSIGDAVQVAPRDGGMIDAPVIDVGGNGMIDAPVIDVDGKPVIKGPFIDVGGGVKPAPGKPGTVKKGLTVQMLDVAIACQVAGTPVEFPDDLLLTNKGPTLSSGTTIKWKVKSAGQGYVQLTSDLPSGASVKARNVLAAGVEAGKPCTAKIV